MKKIPYTPEDLVNHEVVCAVIKDMNGRILVQDHVKYGFLALPVGKAKPGQTIIDGLKEELFEECDIKIIEFKEIASKNYTYTRFGKKVQIHGHLFEITKYSGIIKNKEPNKHRSQEFVDLETIKKAPFLSDMTILYLDFLGFKRKARF